jgi:hypothetical protein
MPALIVHRLHVPPIRRQLIGANSAIGQVTPASKPLHRPNQIGVSIGIDTGAVETLHLAPPGRRNQHVVAQLIFSRSGQTIASRIHDYFQFFTDSIRA